MTHQKEFHRDITNYINTFEGFNDIIFAADINESIIASDTKQFLMQNGLLDACSYCNGDH